VTKPSTVPTKPDTHAIELIDLLGHTADSLELWQVICECGWQVEGASQRVVAGWWREHVEEVTG
jgi:hypothetical protein